MRRLALLTATLALLACDKDTGPTNPPAATPPATTALTPEEEAAAAEKAEADKKAAEAQAQLDAAIAKAETEAEEVKARWTPEITTAFEAMVAKKYARPDSRMKAILKSSHRAPGNVDRDKYRHPDKTLKFFGLKPTMKVFEVGQGAGWYTEILAPFLAAGGQLYLAGADPASEDPGEKANAKMAELFLTAPGPLYAGVETIPQGASGEPMNLGSDGGMDMVLVIRMFHNVERFDLWDAWMSGIHNGLKDGGVLAVVQHRAAADADPKESAAKGYLPEKWLIEKIESYGFKLAAKSEINANPKDTRDYENGVWTLPPRLAEGDTDKDKYLAIGESDRSTLRFVKVAK